MKAEPGDRMNIVKSISMFAFLAPLLDSGAAAWADDACSPREQWYTGSLLSPGGALYKAGLFYVQPYVAVNAPVTRFDARGNAYNAANTTSRSVNPYSFFGYALTDHLTIETVPSFSYVWDASHTSQSVVANDLPVSLRYRLVDPDPARCVPALNFNAAMTFPVGDYNRLSTVEAGGGAGEWRASFTLQTQMTFKLPGDYPMRMRIWANVSQPFNTIGVSGLSIYGASRGFSGHAYTATQGNVGASFEFGLTKQWVLALDVVYNLLAAGQVSGMNYAQGTYYRSRLNSSSFVTLAPAIEYNFAANQGFVFGVSLNPAGRNATGFVSPIISYYGVF